MKEKNREGSVIMNEELLRTLEKVFGESGKVSEEIEE